MEKQKKKGGELRTILIIVAIIVVLIIVASAIGRGDNDGSSSSDPAAGENVQDNNYVSVGSSFDAGDLKITVTESDLNFTSYDDEFDMYTPADGMKYIMVGFTFENTSDSGESYVSIYDFTCYADNTTCEQAYLPDGSDFVNTNLSSGRNVSFRTYYEVPVDCQSIELEYTGLVFGDDAPIIKIQ